VQVAAAEVGVLSSCGWWVSIGLPASLNFPVAENARELNIDVCITFVVCLGLPVPLRVVDGAVVVYACGEEVWRAGLGVGGVDG